MIEGTGSVGGVDVVDVDPLGSERVTKLNQIRDLAGREFPIRFGNRQVGCNSFEHKSFIGVDLASELDRRSRIRSHAVHSGVYFEMYRIWDRIFARRYFGHRVDEVAAIGGWRQRPLNQSVDFFFERFGENEDRQIDTTLHGAEHLRRRVQRRAMWHRRPSQRGQRRCRHGHTRRP